jgi:hypothetical protein
LKRYVNTKQPEDDLDTVYVDLKIDSEENVDTKYVNLYIDTNRDINAKPSYSRKASDYIHTNIAYFNGNLRSNNKPYRSYPRYHRHRQNH